MKEEEEKEEEGEGGRRKGRRRGKEHGEGRRGGEGEGRRGGEGEGWREKMELGGERERRCSHSICPFPVSLEPSEHQFRHVILRKINLTSITKSINESVSHIQTRSQSWSTNQKQSISYGMYGMFHPPCFEEVKQRSHTLSVFSM